MEGAAVGSEVGSAVGVAVGLGVGAAVGAGDTVGESVQLSLVSVKGVSKDVSGQVKFMQYLKVHVLLNRTSSLMKRSVL